MKISGSEADGRVVAYVERALGRMSALAFRRPGIALLLVAAFSGTCGLFAKDLYLDADLASLLPESFDSVRDLRELEKRFGGAGWVVVVGEGAEPEKLIQFAEDVAPKLAALEAVDYVDFQPQARFFQDRGLYYLDQNDLELVRDRIRERVAWEKQRAFVIDIDEAEPPPIHFDDLRKKYNPSGGGDFVANLQKGTEYYLNEKDRMIVLLAKPSSQSIDLDFSKKMIHDVEALLAGVDRSRYGPEMSIQLAGRHKKRVDMQEMIESDLTLVTLIAMLAVVCYLAFHFRRFLAVVLIMGPLTLGMLWTFGFAAFAFAKLNILTGFIGAILLGLGIDHGIHLLGRYESEYRDSSSAEDAVRVTFSRTGRAIAIAALTTTAAFLCLATSEFRAFHEFGAIGGAGMILVVAAYTTTLPALLAVANRLGWRPRPIERRRRSGLGTFVQAHSTAIVAVSFVTVCVALIAATKISFNYNFAALESNNLKSFRYDRKVAQILGHGEAPVLILTRNLEEERYLVEQFRAVKNAAGNNSFIWMVASSSDLVPQNQESKRAVIQEIGEALKPVKARWLENDTDRERLALLRRSIDAEPFSRKDLPRQLRWLFGGADGQSGAGVVQLFPWRTNSGAKLMAFADQLRAVKAADGSRLAAAGEDLIMADVLSMVIREAPPISILTFLVVLATMWILLGKFRNVAICLMPAITTIAVTTGIMPLVGLDVNYLNMVMFPILFGIGVDGGAHLVTRMSTQRDFTEVINDTARAIGGAILTTSVGFGSLAIANHFGLITIGKTAVLGFGINMLASLVMLPAVLAMLRRRVSQKKTPAADDRGEPIPQAKAS